MTAVIIGYGSIDHEALVSGELDKRLSGDWAFVIDVHDEEEVFEIWEHGEEGSFKRAGGKPYTGEQVDRVYHLDESQGEMWTYNARTGALLSSKMWFEDD